MKKIFFLLITFIDVTILTAQPKSSYKIPLDDSTLNTTGSIIQMPFNRLIQSAGKVITYGDPTLENHTLDVTPLPDKENIAIEDRYGIAIFNIKTQQIKTTWTFGNNPDYQDLMSTYSGITSFIYNNTNYIIWSAQSRVRDRGFVMIAEWKNDSIKISSAIQFKATSPAVITLPNQVQVNVENNIPYLYIVLNGSNQLVKTNFTNKKIEWTANTGVAPFGISIVKNKAYITNWAGPLVTDTSRENAGTPWGSAYTNPVTGATQQGTVSIIDINNGKLIKELVVGLHPNAIVQNTDKQFLYVANSNSDMISVIEADKDEVVDSINVGLFSTQQVLYGSSPNGLCTDANGTTLYVANGLDNAIAVIKLGSNIALKGKGKTEVKGYIPTEAYPSGLACLNDNLYITNLEAKGARVLSQPIEFKQPDAKPLHAYTVHTQLASFSIVPLPSANELKNYTEKVKELSLFYRLAITNLPARKNILAQPIPERIGEPSVFKHVVYIIKENKTYDQVFGDIKAGRGDSRLCIFGNNVTPNQHKLAGDFSLLDNYYASGKSSAEGHQWTDAAMVSDYVQKNVRAWFRSYPHRQEDALVYNKSGFIWNNALDHGKRVRVYGEACKSIYDTKLRWLDIYNKYTNHEPFEIRNTTTIARLRPVISPNYPDCDNINLTDQLRADVFIKEWKDFENQKGDNLPDLMVLSMPNDHTAGTLPGFPTPRAMVADNDLALGRIIETITKSRFWDSTVVFVTEDDSQSGWDHISSYRTTSLIISPYSVFNKTIHTNYNQTSMVRTIEQILGIPPMNIIDATALPMFDCFTSKKSSYKYHVISNKIPLNEMNKPLSTLKGKALYYAKLSKTSSFKEVDNGDDNNMNRILWFNAKGSIKYPGLK